MSASGTTNKISDLSELGKPLVLSNCSVKTARSGDSVEFIVNDSTRVEQTKKYQVECKGDVECTEIAKET